MTRFSLSLTVTTQPIHCGLRVPRGKDRTRPQWFSAAALYLAIIMSADIKISESGQDWNLSPVHSRATTEFLPCYMYLPITHMCILMPHFSCLGQGGFCLCTVHASCGQRQPEVPLLSPWSHSPTGFCSSGDTAIVPQSPGWPPCWLTDKQAPKAASPAPQRKARLERMPCPRTSAESGLTGRAGCPALANDLFITSKSFRSYTEKSPAAADEMAS